MYFYFVNDKLLVYQLISLHFADIKCHFARTVSSVLEIINFEQGSKPYGLRSTEISVILNLAVMAILYNVSKLAHLSKYNIPQLGT